MHLKTRLFGFLIALGCAAAPLAAPLAQEPSQAVPAAKPATPACTPVARLFGKTVCREDIAAADEHIEAIKKQYREQGLDPEKAIRTRNMDQLKDMLWMISLRQKFTAAQLEPTEEEIYRYSNALRDSLRQSYEENLKTEAKIKDLLAHRTYTGEEEAKLRSLLQKVETSIRFYDEREAHKGKMPPEFEKMVAEAEHDIAASAIRDWKVNKALYEEYGGKLALRPSGLQPVEAYARFVDFIRTKGKPEILDPAYSDVFSQMEQFAAGTPGTLSPEQEEFYKGYFSSPLWKFEHKAEMAQGNANN